MKKLYLLMVFALMFVVVNATNYYVDGVNGSDGVNSGTSIGSPYKTISKAAGLTNPGDTVFILNGSYSAMTISRPGSAAGQIVYTNYPGHSPKLISNSTTYNVITVSAGTNYITINGLEIEGWGVSLSLAADTTAAQAAIVCGPGATSTTNVTFIPKYNGSGINVGGSTGITHHVVLSNNKIHDCAAAGIGVGYSDYITLDGNIVYNNSWYTPYGTSGISFGNSLNYDNNTTTYRNIVKNNVCYGNRLYVLWRGSCTISDGNGIIIDIPQTGYNGKQLVLNNICYNNGGSGIHTINNNHVDFINNTAYLNSASPTNGGSAIYAYGSDDVKFYNNILVSRPGKSVNRSPNSTNVIYDYNIYYGGSTIDYVGPGSLIQDPKFVNPSTDPAVADFHLQQGSFAINNGDNTHTTTTDKAGNIRPLGSVVDIGAYESSYTGNLNTCNGTTQNKILGSGGGTGEPGAIFYGPYYSKAGTSNQKSRHAFIYPQTLLSASGVPASATLTSLQFKRALQTASTQTVPNNSIIQIYLRNEASDNFGEAAFDWNTILPSSSTPAVLVYGGEASVLIGNAGGWKTIPFQVPFNYTGANLGVYVEYLQKGFVASGTDVQWIYDNGGSQPLYNTATNANQLYATKSTNTTGALLSDGLTVNSERRPVFTVGYCSASILPVTLQQFNAVKKGNEVYINWLVSTEVNSAGYEVQRSKDGVHFETIGLVNSKTITGNSSTLSYYDYTDNNPINGVAYYRLLQKDKEGRETYSSIVSLKNVSGNKGIISMYPNPVINKLNALVNINKGTLATISVQDVTGRILSSFKKQLPAGYSTIEIDVARQAASTYLLIIDMPGERLIEKFIKK